MPRTFLMHPYTAALLSAAPKLEVLDGVERAEIVLTGDVSSPINPPSGCSFRTRCWKAQSKCADERPSLTAHSAPINHRAACHLPVATAGRATHQ